MVRRTGKAVWYSEDNSQHLFIHYKELKPEKLLVIEPVLEDSTIGGRTPKEWSRKVELENKLVMQPFFQYRKSIKTHYEEIIF